MPHPLRIALATSILVSAFVSRGAAAASEPSPLAELDAAWARRADGAEGGTAREGSVEPVLAAGRAALASTPGSLEARWKLMRAFYFKGEYTSRDPEEQKRIFDEGKTAGEEAIALIRKKVAAATGRPTKDDGPVALAGAAREIPGAAATFLWAGVDWGKWALVFGKTAAARKGVAAKIRDDAQAVILMDPTYDDGAGYRLLGRVHHQTPSIPLITGWASRKEALKNLKQAMEIGPRNFYNRLYWAEALHEYEASRRGEARQILEALVADTPSPAFLVEDLRVQEEAKALLSSWGRD